jgi:hypothetical protein
VNQSRVQEAIAEIESKTCIRFSPRNGNTSIISYVLIQSTGSGYEAKSRLTVLIIVMCDAQKPGDFMMKCILIQGAFQLLDG